MAKTRFTLNDRNHSRVAVRRLAAKWTARALVATELARGVEDADSHESFR